MQVENELINLHTGRSLTESTITDAVLIQVDFLTMNTLLLETCSVIIMNVLYNGILLQVGHLLRVTCYFFLLRKAIVRLSCVHTLKEEYAYNTKLVGGPRWLQIGRSLVRSQLVSSEFFIDKILPIALWTWGRLSL